MLIYKDGKNYYATKENNKYYGVQPYIESDGIAYTRLLESGDSLSIKYVSIKFQTLDTSSSDKRYVLGNYNQTSTSDNYFGVITEYVSGSYKFGWSSGGNQQASYFYEFQNNDDIQEYKKVSAQVFTTSNTNFICFGYHYYPYGGYGQKVVPKKIRLWYVTFFNNGGQVVADYVPKIVNNEVGLYDRRRNKFFPNVAGSGQLKYCI